MSSPSDFWSEQYISHVASIRGGRIPLSETRRRIVRHIHAHPGVHFNALVRALDLAPGQIQHHLKVLLADHDIVEEHLYGRTHYYQEGFDPWKRQALALLRRETSRDVITVLLRVGPAAPSVVADELDIARSTLEWHLDRLESAQLVRKERDNRNHVTVVLDRPSQTAALLRDADPTLLGRLADRYTRLVDRLLAE